MLLDQLHQMSGQLNQLAVQCGASRLRVFGSVARREETPESDVDFVVDLPRGYDLFTQRIPLAQAIGDLLRRKVDLIPEHEINPRLRTHILAEAVAI